jgi:hypothetical protein
MGKKGARALWCWDTKSPWRLHCAHQKLDPGQSRTDDSGWLITLSSEVINVVEKAKTLTAKEKTGEFKSQQERDQFSVALKNEEHHGHTRAISSIASWKEGFAYESHLYKKRKTQEIAHNTEEIFAQQFFNFMRKNPQYVVQMTSSEINLDLSATIQQPIALSSADSAPNGWHQGSHTLHGNVCQIFMWFEDRQGIMAPYNFE